MLSDWLNKKVIWSNPAVDCKYHGRIIGIDGKFLIVKDIVGIERISPDWISHSYEN